MTGPCRVCNSYMTAGVATAISLSAATGETCSTIGFYLVANATPFAAFSMSEATACGCDT